VRSARRDLKFAGAFTAAALIAGVDRYLRPLSHDRGTRI
jgi:hypothetical protein